MAEPTSKVFYHGWLRLADAIGTGPVTGDARALWHRVRRLLGAAGRGCSVARSARIGCGWRVRLGKEVRVGRRAVIDAMAPNGGPIVLGDRSRVREGAMLLSHGGPITIGAGSTVNQYCMLYGHGGLTIGDNVRIAAHTVIVPANHRFEDPDVPIALQGEDRLGIRIGDDVWIGANCVVLDGVTIGSGAVIAAGSVVSGDIPPLSVAAGTPARVVRMRGDRLPKSAARSDRTGSDPQGAAS